MMRFANLAKEFPDFDLSSLPEVPAAWSDESWHNDACPCFLVGTFKHDGNDERKVYAYIDYAEPQEREIPESPRFNLHAIALDGNTQHLIDSDDWQAVLVMAARSIETPKGE